MVDLTLTDAAAEKAKRLLASSPEDHEALRVAVKNGGCSGMRYELLFDGTRRDDDTELVFQELKVWVDAESATFLDGITIDFADGLNDAGFKIENPGAAETCGCGESFAL